MQKIFTKVTDSMNFFGSVDPVSLVEKYGTPLYVYNERILRQRCRELKNLTKYPDFVVDYSIKANSGLAFLQIVRSEGLSVDAMSPGEIYTALAAGFEPKEIFYICDNVDEAEMRYAIDAGVVVSVDSVEQLEQYGSLNPGGEVAVRFNGGFGAGAHEKITTAGKKTKFGIDPEFIPEVKEIIKKYSLKLIGINQHIGSLVMDGESFVSGAEALFSIARQFPGLEFIDLGGGFGIPYKKEEGEAPLDIQKTGEAMDKLFFDFAKEYGKVTFRIEPGRYISAECCVLLGTVTAVKENFGQKYVGCDIGFNVLQRPVMYDSYHGVEIFRPGGQKSEKQETVKIVGNICESGDILANMRTLPEIFKGDVLCVLDAGAYGFSMASSYNLRLRPAEVFLRENGECVLVREREELSDMLRHQIGLKDL